MEQGKKPSYRYEFIEESVGPVMADLLDKVDYYLAHEKEREEIARNGNGRVAAVHTYRHRVRQMLNF